MGWGVTGWKGEIEHISNSVNNRKREREKGRKEGKKEEKDLYSMRVLTQFSATKE